MVAQVVAPAERPGGTGHDKATAATRVVWVTAALFVALFSSLVLYKHSHLGTRAFDLGIFDQGTWLLSRFETPFVTVRGLHLFADHSSYLLVLLAPLYWIWDDVRALLLLTVLAMAAGGPIVYYAARAEGLSRKWAAAVGIAFLAMPAVHWHIWDVFHPETLAIPILLGAYLAAVKRRHGWSVALMGIALLAKEDVALIVVPLAIYLGWRLRSRLIGIAGSGLGLTALVVNFAILLPHFSPTGELIYSGRYRDFGDTFPEILAGVITSPIEVVTIAFDGDGLLYLAALILPLAVSLLAPEVLVLAAPTLLANLLSRHYYQAELKYHYTAYAIVAITIATVVGTRRLLDRLEEVESVPRRASIAVLVGALVVGSVIAGPWGFGQRNPWTGHADDPELVREALALIPDDASVAADSRLVPHLAHRQTIYSFPNPMAQENWSVGNRNPAPKNDFDWLVVRADLAGMDPVFMGALNRVIRSDEFVIVAANEEITVYQRVAGFLDEEGAR